MKPAFQGAEVADSGNWYNTLREYFRQAWSPHDVQTIVLTGFFAGKRPGHRRAPLFSRSSLFRHECVVLLASTTRVTLNVQRVHTTQTSGWTPFVD